MAKLRCILVQLILIITLFYDVESTTKGADYAVTVIAFPENGRFKSGQLVPLQCTITPTPAFPVVYIWRSSTQNHYPSATFTSSAPFTTVLINDNHPLYGHYYCHVLSASNRTTLAVGHVTINPTGILRPTGTTDKLFTPPGPLELEVELQSEDDELLNILSSIIYDWQHNYTALTDEVVNSRQEKSGFMINNSSLTIANTSSEDAGVYSVKIDSFSVLNTTNKGCANIVLVTLRNYAIFKEVEFFARNSEVSIDISVLNLEPSPQSFVTKEVLFIIGEPLTTNTSIPIARRHATLIRNPNTTFQRRVFYNGELITTTNPSKEVRLPSEVITGVAPMLGEMAIMVRLKLPRPIPEDEGVYEVQLFVDISQLPTPNCLDYTDFIRTSDGLDLPNVLVGSATLYIRQQGPPQVMVAATKQVLTSADGTEPLPKLTCSVMEDDRLPIKQLRWTKDGKVLAEVQDTRILAFDTATNPITVSPFGLYTCEAIFNTTSQIKAENSILIAERANFMMELEPINDIRCLDLSKETLQLMLDMLLEEILFSFSYETEADFTRDNFARSSITCSSEGSSIIMSTDVIYSNSNGSITASALVETAEDWMNGIRTANGATFQITRPETAQSPLVDTGQIIAIVLSTFSFGIIMIGITILISCCIANRQRKHSKKQKLDQMHKHNPAALPERESVVGNSIATMNHPFQQSEGSIPALPTRMALYDRLVEDSRSVPLLINTMGGPPDIIPPAFSESINNPISSGAPNNTIHSRGTLALLPKVQGTNDDDEVVYSSLSVMENYAYNRRQDLSGLGHPRSKNQPNQNVNNDRMFFNQRQRSVHHYDYPTVNKVDLCAEETDSMGYQSVNDVVKE